MTPKSTQSLKPAARIAAAYITLVNTNQLKSYEEKPYLHDELDGSDKVGEELEDEVLLLLLHLVETVLLAAGGDLGVGQTGAGVGLQQLVRHGTLATGLVLVLLVDLVDVAVLRLEVGNELIHVLVLLVFLGHGALLLVERGRGLLLVLSLIHI